MYKKTCNVNFQSNYATIEGIGQISVDDYCNSKYSSINIPRCIPNNHELILVNGTKKRSHFRHKHNCDMEGTPMTDWHAEWQSNFPITEVSFKDKYGQIKNRRADILIENFKRIIEIQHSHPSEPNEVSNRNKDYGLHGYKVIWIIHSQDSIKVKKIGERRVLFFESNPWLYKEFLDCEYVYYDIEGFIYTLNPSLVRSDQIDVCEPKIKSDFIEILKSQTNIWEDEKTPQSYLYVKQKGAGSGKTYGIMQLLNSDREISNFRWIVFITKQHAAVNVMYSEFMDQYNKNKLFNIEMINNPEEHQTPDKKKYIVRYKHKITNVETCAIFATVDSFTYAIGIASKNVSNTFNSIVQSIIDGTSKVKSSGSLKFADVDPYINKETIVMIDETQDLSELYGDAFLKFVSSTHTNLCVVGDRLQSLTYRENALTKLHRAELVMMKAVREEATNKVIRFSNPRLINFVNSIIPFEKYELPRMTASVIEEENKDALTIFTSKTIYANQSIDDESVIEAVSQIMLFFKKEVEINNRLPEDFLIVTPFTSKNPLVEALCLAINIFWKDIMEININYIENVKNKNDYWKNINPNEYTRYAIFHKSQEMGSINLSESEHATRIVSIHSSKGDGRKVVFVIGLTQSSLQVFSQVADNLIYDSLLHVAITRQKQKLYFRLEGNKDNIHKRILNFEKNCNQQIIQESNSQFDFAKGSIKLQHISDDIRLFFYDELNENIISKNTLPVLPSESNENLLIDMGDHNIRYASMFINIIVHICNHEQRTNSDTKHQFYAILSKLRNDILKPIFGWTDYIKILEKNTKDKKHNKEKRYIPILQFDKRDNDKDYNRYFFIILETMTRIIEELKLVGKNQIHYFCPLESVILYYMIECLENGKFQKITINDLYNIIDIYSKVYDDTSSGHEYCHCTKHFPNKSNTLTEKQIKQKKYLYNHYNRLTHICSILDNFVLSNPNVNWLYNHAIELYSEIHDFNIHTGFPLVGYDDKNVFVFIIKPQFNDINFNEIIVDSIFNTWILMNSSTEKNKDKFSNKSIKTCVLSLNKNEIYIIDWTKVIEENKDFLINLIYKTLYNKFRTKHEQYYNTLECIVNEIGTPTKIIEDCLKQSEKTNACTYINNYWITLKTKIILDKKKTIEEYKNKEDFIKTFDKLLDISLMGYLGMIDEEEN